MHLTGPGYSFVGKTGRDGLNLRLPPGDYQFTVNKPNFTQMEEHKSVSILPGSCPTLRVPIESVSTVSGRIVDFRGAPVRNAIFHLQGYIRPAATFFETAANAVHNTITRLTGWNLFIQQEYLSHYFADTDGDGRFLVKSVYPGRYYLVSDIGNIRETSHPPLPETYYPGVPDWQHATQLVVEEGRSLDNVYFQLPDFGQRQRSR